MTREQWRARIIEERKARKMTRGDLEREAGLRRYDVFIFEESGIAEPSTRAKLAAWLESVR